MKKRYLAAMLLVCLLLGTVAHAAEPRISYTPELSFSGTTANCMVVVSAFGQPITVVLELSDEDGVIKTWTSSGRNYVKIEDTYPVVSGETYTLQASGTINGVAFDRDVVTGTCP